MKKDKGKMSIGGTIEVQLTEGTLDDLLKGKQVTIGTGNAMEFYLAVKTGSKDAIVSFSPWFDASDCKLSIENSVAIDGEFHERVEIILRDTEDRRVGVQVNIDQAEALAGVLQHYAQAWRALEALKADCPAA